MNIFVTGKPRSGKSTLVREVIEELRKRGKNIAGIITPEISGDGGRRGFEIKDLASGKRRALASVDIKDGPRVAKYGVNVEGIDEVVGEFEKSFKKAEVVFIDEVGKMEFFSPRFKEVLDTVLSSGKTVVATLHRDLVGEFGKYGKVFELTAGNFEDIKKKIIKEVEGALGS